MKITLLGEPKSTQSIYRTACRGRFASFYMTAKGKSVKSDYQRQVAEQWSRMPLEGSIRLIARFYFGTHRKCDLDNFNKLLLDSLTGIVFLDDSQIDEFHLYKDYDQEIPRIELDVDTQKAD